ncbi:amidohydrolase family protein [Streptomyces hygroscopicus]|uniref:amidohydrolase family protein n=1 Tax=Streptomyces hygroscopicus TaxID=1912 RepID=UPI000767D3B7|nr:amidohydrolase family protein [Streptomyces hygroscopicus]
MNVPNDWVDVHAHFTPPTTPEERRARWQAMREECFTLPAPYHWSLEETLRAMDRDGIAMQLLSNIPKDHAALAASNDYGAWLVREHPSRFGLLAAVPTDDPDAALAEIERARTQLGADGFAVTTVYNGVPLGDPSLDAVWAELDRLGATVFIHPDAYAPGSMGRPSPLIEVAFDTARTITDLVYRAHFRRFPHLTHVVAHCGGALPALSGRLGLLGGEAWVPNPEGLTPADITGQLGRLYLDTAATATDHTLAAALLMTGPEHIVYGSDSGVPCSTDRTIRANLEALLDSQVLDRAQIDAVGRAAFRLFPSARARHDQARAATTRHDRPGGTATCAR